MFELTIFLNTIIFKIYSLIYYYKNINKLDNFKNLNKLQAMLFPLVRYTDLSIFLALIWSYKAVFNYKISPKLTCTTWCILNNVSIAYWAFKKNIINKEPDSNSLSYKCSEFMTHGGFLLLMLKDLNKYPFDFSNIKYPIILSLFWYIGIIVPYEKYTSIKVYPFLNSKYKSTKLLIFSFIFIINCITGYFGSIVSKNKLKILYSKIIYNNSSKLNYLNNILNKTYFLY